MSIWLTRPQRDSERMEAALAALGIASVVGPVMEITQRRVSFTGLTKPDALVLTSRRAAHALADAPADWRSLPVYCVGQATAQAAQRHHFMHTRVGSGSALALAPLITQHHGGGARLLHLAGDALKVDLAPLLAAQQIALDKIIAYESHCAVALTVDVTHALHVGALTGVVFYSPRSVQFAAQLAAEALPTLHAYCLSEDIAAHAALHGCKRVFSCPTPTHQAMMALLSQHAMKGA